MRRTPPCSRIVGCLTVLVLLLPLTGDPADCREDGRVVLVLDRGSAAKDGAAADAGNALRIVKALQARGTPATLLAIGSTASGRIVSTRPTATEEGLEQLGSQQDYAFRGPTDVRGALGQGLAAAGGGSRVDVLLLGPFGAADAPSTAAKRAVESWNDKAPQGSRILPVGITKAGLDALRGARGLISGGHVVIGLADPDVKVDPFSPLPGENDEPSPLTARVRLLVDVLHLGVDTPDAAVVAVVSDVGKDAIATKILAGLHDFTLSRRQRDGRTATVSFKPAGGEGVVWLCDTPRPVAFRWDELKQAVQLVGPKGGLAPVFSAADAQADAPVRVSYRIRRSRKGPEPAWRVGSAVGALPEGLAVRIGDELPVTPEIAETEVAITYTAQPATPTTARGVVTLKADGFENPLEIPYEIKVGPGKARLEVDPKPTALPVAEKDEHTKLRVVAVNGNVPPTVGLFALSETNHARWLTGLLKSPTGDVTRWPMTERVDVKPGVGYELSFQLAKDAPDVLDWPAEFVLKLSQREGLDTEGEGTVPVRRRRPHLELVDSNPAFFLDEDRLVADRTFVLRLDPDGGDGDWVLQLMKTAPTISIVGDAPVGWQAVGKGAGEWEIVPTGDWKGEAPKVFRETEQRVEIQIQWAEGDTPGMVEVPIRVPPRWGARGWVFVGLAGGAVLLALIILFAMRAAPVKGMLIYTVDSLEGAVGRLDLSEVGRRVAQITADEKGRLSESKEGEAVMRIIPTRVGGMLEYTEKGHKERRLLVDGLSLRADRYILRYVSGESGEPPPELEDVPDLLGEDFDLAWGKVDALDDPFASEADGKGDEKAKGDAKKSGK